MEQVFTQKDVDRIDALRAEAVSRGHEEVANKIQEVRDWMINMAIVPYVIYPKAGDYVEPDGWAIGARLLPGEAEVDWMYLGCLFRLPSRHGDLAVNVTVTGRKVHYVDGYRRMRCLIEFAGDGEPSTYTRGWITAR